MSKSITWKLVLIGGVLALSVWLFYPPKEKINLGLDLQGGSHLVLQVETSAAVKSEIDLAINRIGQMMKEKSIPYSAIASSTDLTIESVSAPLRILLPHSRVSGRSVTSRKVIFGIPNIEHSS